MHKIAKVNNQHVVVRVNQRCSVCKNAHGTSTLELLASLLELGECNKQCIFMSFLLQVLQRGFENIAGIVVGLLSLVC
jgi:hypothetical protein